MNSDLIPTNGPSSRPLFFMSLTLEVIPVGTRTVGVTNPSLNSLKLSDPLFLILSIFKSTPSKSTRFLQKSLAVLETAG